MRGLLAVALCFACIEGMAQLQTESLRVASVQMAVTPDIKANCVRILLGINNARQENAQMVLFPETALSGFDRECVESMDWDALSSAETRIAKEAAKAQVYLLYGTVTRREEGRPFNSAVLVDPDGKEVMRYHKLVPEPWFEPGDHLAQFQVAGIPCTMIICHDSRFPELVRLPVLAGAKICFYISYEINGVASAVRKADNYRAQVIARAAENGIWMVQSNGFGPVDGGAMSLGQSRIVDPGGTVRRELPVLQDAIMVEDIDPQESSRGNARESLGIRPLAEWWQAGLKLLPPTPAR